jgi:hypothetical protein
MSDGELRATNIGRGPRRGKATLTMSRDARLLTPCIDSPPLP